MAPGSVRPKEVDTVPMLHQDELLLLCAADVVAKSAPLSDTLIDSPDAAILGGSEQEDGGFAQTQSQLASADGWASSAGGTEVFLEVPQTLRKAKSMRSVFDDRERNVVFRFGHPTSQDAPHPVTGRHVPVGRKSMWLNTAKLGGTL